MVQRVCPFFAVRVETGQGNGSYQDPLEGTSQDRRWYDTSDYGTIDQITHGTIDGKIKRARTIVLYFLKMYYIFSGLCMRKSLLNFTSLHVYCVLLTICILCLSIIL